MLREPAKLIAYRQLVLDALLTLASFLIAHQLRSELLPRVLPGVFGGGLYPLRAYLPLAPVVLVIWVALLAAAHLTSPGVVFSLPREIARVLRVAVVATLAIAAAGYLFRLQFVSRPFLILFAATNAAALSAARLLERRTHWGRQLMRAPERVVIVVGCGEEAARMARQIDRHRSWGLTLRGLLDTDGCGLPTVDGFPVVGTVGDLPTMLTTEVIDEVVLAVPTRQLGEMETLLSHCQELGVRVRLALRPFPHLQPRVEVETLENVPLLTFSTMPTDPLALFLKGLMDVIIGAAVFVLTAPLWLVIAAAVRLSSRGPVLYRQERSGLHGRRFKVLKFRTMIEGADKMQPDVAHLNVMDGPVFKAQDDPRITSVGRFLRRFSLDELPQLINVLKGDMSLVGPRPPIPDEVARYETWQRRRLAMKPGLTCLWQISGRSELDFATWMELDLAYIDNWSLWLDVKILALTVPAVLGGRGAA